MVIYRIQVVNASMSEELKNLLLYFESKELAEKLMNAFNRMTLPDKTIEWRCDVINVMNEKDVLDQFKHIGV